MSTATCASWRTANQQTGHPPLRQTIPSSHRGLSCRPTIQNTADLQWPLSDPANVGVRDEFQLNTFPPDNPSPTPPPTRPTPPAK